MINIYDFIIAKDIFKYLPQPNDCKLEAVIF